MLQEKNAEQRQPGRAESQPRGPVPSQDRIDLTQRPARDQVEHRQYDAGTDKYARDRPGRCHARQHAGDCRELRSIPVEIDIPSVQGRHRDIGVTSQPEQDDQHR